MRDLIHEWRTDAVAERELRLNRWQERFDEVGAAVPEADALLRNLKEGVSTSYLCEEEDKDYTLELIRFLSVARHFAKTREYYDQEYATVPLVVGRAMTQYIGAADTNFPEFFYLEHNTVYIRDTTPEGIKQAATVLPFTYFQSTGAVISVMPALKKTHHVQYSPPLLRACFFYQIPGYMMDYLVDQEHKVFIQNGDKLEISRGEGQELATAVFRLGGKRVRYTVCAEQRPEIDEVPPYVQEWLENIEQSHGLFPKFRPAQLPVVHVRVMYEHGQMILTEGVSSDCKQFEYEGVTYACAEGEGVGLVTVPQIIHSLIQSVFSPTKWVVRDMTELVTYKKNNYSDIQASHIPMAKHIVAHLPPDAILVEPGAGTGLFARLWKGEGYYGDLVRNAATHPLVLEEDASQTVARAEREASDPTKIVIINSFISRFYTQVTHHPTIWIDHDFILDRVPQVERVSEALFVTNCPTSLMVALDRYGRRKWRPYHLPYTRNARHLRALVIRQLSRAALEIVRSCPGLKIYCPDTLESYMLHSGADYEVFGPGKELAYAPQHVPVLATTFSQMELEPLCYFVPIGKEVRLDDALLFTGKKPTMLSRALYYVTKDCSHRVPEGAIAESAYKDTGEEVIYFALPEDVQRATVSYRVGKDFFRAEYTVIPSEGKDKWAVEEVVRAKLTSASTRAEVRSLLEDLGVPAVQSVIEAYFSLLQSTY